MAEPFSEGIIQAFQAGRRIKMEREEQAHRAEDRKLRLDLIEDARRREKRQEQIERRNVQLQSAQLLEGRPGEQVPGIPAEFTPEQPTAINGLLANLPASISREIPEQQLPHPTQRLEAIPELGLGEQTYQPRTEQDVERSKIRSLLQAIGMEGLKPFTLGLRDVRFDRGKKVAENAPKSETAKFGTEVPYPPDVMAQKERIASASAARKALPKVGTEVPYPPDVMAQKERIASASAARISTRQERGAELKDLLDAKRRIKNRGVIITDAERRLGIMEHALANPNPQNDVALLFNHIGMTLSAQRGARITNAEIHRAITARSIPSDILALWQKVETGEFLTPEQRNQMVELARQGVAQARDDAFSEAEMLGVPIGDVLPGLDRNKESGTGSGGIKIIRDANGRIVGIE